ncbi:MAG: hypothetical protein VR64_21425 [Desulfatitalea sp. BRH_c12]|nr:MAG: hypothetical protein VR64_21425 [Desulfatitalea sp. BRH_c12]
MVLSIAPAHAHKVIVFAWVEGDTIHTESKFSAGKLVQDGKIAVFDPQGNKLLEGVTDDRGRFSFPIPQKSDLKIELQAGMGHGNQWLVRAQEIDDGADSRAPTPKQTPSEAGHTGAAPARPTEASATADCLDAQTVRQIVTLALEKKLAPIEARLVEQRWRFQDIIGGIGYIVGIFGVVAYMKSRK